MLSDSHLLKKLPFCFGVVRADIPKICEDHSAEQGFTWSEGRRRLLRNGSQHDAAILTTSAALQLCRLPERRLLPPTSPPDGLSLRTRIQRSGVRFRRTSTRSLPPNFPQQR